MNKLFSEFPKVSKAEWEEKLTKELKGADFDSSLKRKDEIEELDFSTYAHESDRTKSIEVPGEFPYTRGVKQENNDWNVASWVTVQDEKKANQNALNLLMTGANGLIFDLVKKELDLITLFDQIGFEFIESQFLVYSVDQFRLIYDFFKDKSTANVSYRFDFFSKETLDVETLKQFVEINKSSTTRFCFIDMSSLQQCGASITQQLSFGLACGHEYLVQLMGLGYTIDEASQSLHFSSGVGNNYFYETAKLRAFRMLWSKLVNAYHPEKAESLKCHLSSEVTWMNKSLKDPYTNLLRQTTEAMSAVSGGVDTLLVQPYDGLSKNGVSTLAGRMAINISLILKEESYFDKVIDPVGGSYSIEQLTDQIAEKSWKKFQQQDALGGINTSEGIRQLKSEIEGKVSLRLEKVKSGKQVLIGINKFSNPQHETGEWKEATFFMGMKKIVFERDLQ